MSEAVLNFPTDVSEGQASRDHQRAYRALRQRVAATKAPAFWPAFPPKPALSVLERAGLIRLVGAIPGLCSEPKMHALIEIMRHAPSGDIVDLGTGWGRSAALLARLSERYDLGHVLCIDSWMNESGGGGDSLVDPDEALRMFQINLAPLAGGRLNYIRAQPRDAASLYRPDLAVSSETFGDTHYQGAIAVLHLAGEAAADPQKWLPRMARGGWIVLDGYEGCDGAQSVADALVGPHGGDVSTAFQVGGALFIQLRCPHHD